MSSKQCENTQGRNGATNWLSVSTKFWIWRITAGIKTHLLDRVAAGGQDDARAAQNGLENRGEKAAESVEEAGDFGFVPEKQLIGRD